MGKKKIEVQFPTNMVPVLRQRLEEMGIKEAGFSNVMGFGEKGKYLQFYRGQRYAVALAPQAKLEVLAAEEEVRQIVEMIRQTVLQEGAAEGWIAVLPVEEVYFWGEDGAQGQ